MMVPMTVPDHSPPGGGSVSENRSDPPTLAQVTAVIERLWPASLAESWDAVGPVVGRPDAPVRRILFAVDPVQAVADEAVELGADLLLTHHPLLLRGATTVAAGGHSGAAKGAVVHTLIEHGIGLVAAHTNADSAVGGVSDAIARRLGVTGVRPLAPSAGGDGDTGIGRVGELESPVSLRGFAERVAAVVPATAGGVRVAGDLDAEVRRVAVCGGTDGVEQPVPRAADADVYVTSDLRHHPASEARETALLGDGRPALVDVAHFAGEWLWLADGAHALREALEADGFAVDTVVSAHVTDPWDLLVGGGGRP